MSVLYLHVMDINVVHNARTSSDGGITQKPNHRQNLTIDTTGVWYDPMVFSAWHLLCSQWSLALSWDAWPAVYTPQHMYAQYYCEYLRQIINKYITYYTMYVFEVLYFPLFPFYNLAFQYSRGNGVLIGPGPTLMMTTGHLVTPQDFLSLPFLLGLVNRCVLFGIRFSNLNTAG